MVQPDGDGVKGNQRLYFEFEETDLCCPTCYDQQKNE